MSSALSGDLWRVYQEDARNTDSFLDRIAQAANGTSEPFLTTTISSPPYANIVDYGVPHQIGFSQTYEKYLEECRSIFKALFKWTRVDGSLWIIADTVTQAAQRGTHSRLRPLPFDLARMAESVGWTLRDVIVWRKDRTRPWSSRGRLRNGFEYVLYLVKTDTYKYRVERLRDFSGLRSWWVRYPERHNPWGMAPDNVWDIPIPLQGSWATAQLRHACPFPPALVERILLLSTDESDVVFDPFAGSGMVAAVSEALGRVPLGTELNPTFIEAYEQHVRPNVIEDREAGESRVLTITSELLLTLRVLKFPRELLRQVLRAGVKRQEIRAIVVSSEPFDLEPRAPGSSYAEITCDLWLADSVGEPRGQEILKIAEHVSSRPPLSKFTLSSTAKVSPIGEGARREAKGTLSIYRNGKTWSQFDRQKGDWRTRVADWDKDSLPPILSTLSLDQPLELP